MSKREKNLWQGINPVARGALSARDYRTASFAQELAQRGVEARHRGGARHVCGWRVLLDRRLRHRDLQR